METLVLLDKPFKDKEGFITFKTGNDANNTGQYPKFGVSDKTKINCDLVADGMYLIDFSLSHETKLLTDKKGKEEKIDLMRGRLTLNSVEPIDLEDTKAIRQTSGGFDIIGTILDFKVSKTIKSVEKMPWKKFTSEIGRFKVQRGKNANQYTYIGHFGKLPFNIEAGDTLMAYCRIFNKRAYKEEDFFQIDESEDNMYINKAGEKVSKGFTEVRANTIMITDPQEKK